MSETHEPESQRDETVVAVAEAPREKVDQKPRTERQPPYNVIILNDETHTFDYVIELLMKLFKHSQATAKMLTSRVHLRMWSTITSLFYSA
jgi:ATP-dependent Clp protease adaptor protein ClpS